MVKQVETNARDSGYFVVYVNGARFSQHTTEREAQKTATNQKLRNEAAEVYYTHEYSVDIAIQDVPSETQATVVPESGIIGNQGGEVGILRVSNVETASGPGYTATHYSSATGTEPFATATSYLTPCAPLDAMSGAVAGNQVMMLPGTMLADWSTDGICAFNPSNSGTSGAEIVFFAENPAATNQGSPALWTEMGINQSTGQVYGSGHAAARDYIIWDGIYTDENRQIPRSSEGLISIRGTNNTNRAVGNQIRRGYFNRIDGLPTGDNHNSIHFKQTDDSVVTDCYFTGGFTSNEENNGCIETYGDRTFDFRNNHFYQVGLPYYIKGVGGTSTRGQGLIRYNKIDHPNMEAMRLCAMEDSSIYQNLIIGDTTDSSSARSMIRLWYLASTAYPLRLDIYNNTIITGVQNNVSAGGIQEVITWFAMPYTGYDIYNNIIYTPSGSNAAMIYLHNDISASNSFNYNHYYDADNVSPRWYGNGSTYNDLSSWQTGASVDANATYSDPGFENEAGGNYTLATGANARTSGTGGGICGCYITSDQSDDIGIRSNPSY